MKHTPAKAGSAKKRAGARFEPTKKRQKPNLFADFKGWDYFQTALLLFIVAIVPLVVKLAVVEPNADEARVLNWNLIDLSTNPLVDMFSFYKSGL
ncbi:MAG: hypothetical protein LBS62_08875, partial [Clostridiales bacterium]|nr:hypothetical protein [Clostridiales bacterium]